MNETTAKVANGKPTANWYPHSRADSGTYLKPKAEDAGMTKGFLADAERTLRNQPLIKIKRLIDWKLIGVSLEGLYRHDVATAPQSLAPYDPVSMFKLILLGHWHQLSDAELENALLVRIDFILFCGFDTLVPLPDSATICGFRCLLTPHRLEEDLIHQVELQLRCLGLQVQETHGAILDAAIVAGSKVQEPVG